LSFLNAEWRKLVLLNYEVDPTILTKYLPFGTELDFWNNKCYVSIVGFMFMNTKILGIKVPFHVNFEEVNLRFYVRRKQGDFWKRGVVFIKELVPKPALTFVANTIYNENYQTTSMKHVWNENPSERNVEYYWKVNSVWQYIKVKAETEATVILSNSEAEFITEHYWGYARVNNNKTNEYEVTHPRWLQYKVLDYEHSIDFKANYGEAFELLMTQKPVSVLLAEGSEITVEGKKTLT
jgi:uncharacterized protein YqjF (DUF2071 family)